MNYDLAREHRIGRRPSNQDYVGHDDTGEAVLLAVADGMGGYAGGELAAEIAVGSLLHAFATEATPRLAAPDAFLHRALGRAHAAIRGYAGAHGLPEVPRTVIVACVVQGGRAWWDHVGDARLYLLRAGRVAVRTRDHTPVQELVDAGEVSEEHMARHPDSHRVLQSLGAPDTPEPGPGGSAPLEQGDILLLCSDGFWAPLRPAQLARGLADRSIQVSLAELSDLAERRAGAHADNLTALALQWNGEGTRAGAPEQRPDCRTGANAGGSTGHVPRHRDPRAG